MEELDGACQFLGHQVCAVLWILCHVASQLLCYLLDNGLVIPTREQTMWKFQFQHKTVLYCLERPVIDMVCFSCTAMTCPSGNTMTCTWAVPQVPLWPVPQVLLWPVLHLQCPSGTAMTSHLLLWPVPHLLLWPVSVYCYDLSLIYYDLSLIYYDLSLIYYDLSLRYCNDLSLIYCYDLSLIYCYDLSLVYCYNLSLIYCYDLSLRYCYDLSLIYYDLSLRYCYDLSLRYCYDLSLRYCYDLSLIYYDLSVSYCYAKKAQKIQECVRFLSTRVQMNDRQTEKKWERGREKSEKWTDRCEPLDHSARVTSEDDARGSLIWGRWAVFVQPEKESQLITKCSQTQEIRCETWRNGDLVALYCLTS